MTDTTLLADLESANEGSRELDWRIDAAIDPGRWSPAANPALGLLYGPDELLPYTTSIDAALSLHDSERWVFLLGEIAFHLWAEGDELEGRKIARHLCIEKLSALRAIEAEADHG